MRQKKLYVLSLSLIAASAANSLFGSEGTVGSSVDPKAFQELQENLKKLQLQAVNTDGVKTIITEQSQRDDKNSDNNGIIVKAADDAINRHDGLKDAKKLAERTVWALAKTQVVKAGANLIIDNYIAPFIPFHRLSGRDKHIATMDSARKKFKDNVSDKKQQLKTLSISDVDALEQQFKNIETMQNSGVADYTERGLVAPWYVTFARSKRAETLEKHILAGSTKIIGITLLDGLQNFAVARWRGQEGKANGIAPKNKTAKSYIEFFAETTWLLRDELSDGSIGVAGSSDIWGEHRDTHKFEMAIIADKISRIRRSVEQRIKASSSTSAAVTAPAA